MPSISLTLADVEQSVARPVIFSILDQIFDITNLSKDTEVRYNSKRNIGQTVGSSIDETDRSAKFAADRYTFIDVTEVYDLNAMQETHTHAFEHIPVFEDQKLKFSLRPIYTTSDVTIQIKYRSSSETEVRRWMTEMLQRTSRGRDINLHDIKYTYSLPFPCVATLEDVWTLREGVEPYGDTLEAYFTKHASERFTILSNRAGDGRMLAVTEKQTRIQGMFDFVGIPEVPTRDDDSGSWELSFSYKFSYQRPDSVFMHYPITVHNQFLPKKYLDFLGTEMDPDAQNLYYSKSYEALSLFEHDRRVRDSRQPFPYIRMPSFDDFHLEAVTPGTSTVFTALCFLDDTKRDLLDLKDLGDYVIDKDILDFLQGESSYLTKLYHSLCYISLYVGDEQVLDSKIEVTPDLMVRATTLLDPRKVYHVRVSLMVEVNMALQASIDRLGRYPKAFVKLLGALNELLRLDPDFNNLGNRRHIEAWEMTDVFRILSGHALGAASGPNTALQAYPNSGVGGWSYGQGYLPHRSRDTGKNVLNTHNGFLAHIDPKTMADYFRDKRRVLTSVMTLGIVIHPVSELE